METIIVDAYKIGDGVYVVDKYGHVGRYNEKTNHISWVVPRDEIGHALKNISNRLRKDQSIPQMLQELDIKNMSLEQILGKLASDYKASVIRSKQCINCMT